jgi:hypothetical protein
MFDQVVDLERSHHVVTGGALVRLVSQDLGTEGLPLRRAVPPTEGIVGAGLFHRDRMGTTAAPTGEQDRTPGHGAEMGRA